MREDEEEYEEEKAVESTKKGLCIIKKGLCLASEINGWKGSGFLIQHGVGVVGERIRHRDV